MKIYNKKGVIFGAIWAGLGMTSLVTCLIKPEKFLPEQIKDFVLASLLIVIGLVSFIRAFSKSATQEDKIAEQDERDILIMMKSKAKTLDILCWGFILLLLLGIFWYLLTKNFVWIYIFMASSLCISFAAILYFIILLYYENHE